MGEVLYVGGYSGASENCLHCLEYVKDEFVTLDSYELSNAAYLCVSQDGKFLYAVVETDTFRGLNGGGVAAYAIEGSGRLRFINEMPSEGPLPCHLSVSGDGRSLYVANYSGGSSVMYNLAEDGSINPHKFYVYHGDIGKPSLVNANRQKKPHAHYIQPIEIGCKETVWVCDLGIDAVLLFDVDGHLLKQVNFQNGFGARHTSFHPKLPIGYVVGELSKAVISVDYSDMEAIKTSSPVPVLPDGDVTCAAIRVSPDGRYLLVSNRGDKKDSLSVLELGTAGEVMGPAEVYRTSGICPRDFIFTPKGDEVIVAYQDSDFIEVLCWSNGSLSPKNVKYDVQKPSCVLFRGVGT